MYFIKKFFFNLKRKKRVFLLDCEKDKEFIKKKLNNQSVLGVDTEFMWRNTYLPILSLIQISSPKNIYLIDCIKANNLDFLKEILENVDLLIFHSVRSDATVLSSNFNIKVKKVFDIQVAERFIEGGDNKNYGSIVKKYFPINLKKSETNSNWLNRPFSDKQLIYASEDVEHLIEIFEKQKKILVKNNKINEVLKKSSQEAAFGNRELYISRLSKFKNSTDKQKKLFMWRENKAKEKNIPSSFIFKDKYFKNILKFLNNENDFIQLDKIIKDRVLKTDLIKHFNK
tara:strand:- start:1009 stop:1863 length:855 start_codon:yes stop_codon:yes gene_type:complete